MRNISQDELNKILKEHGLWLKRKGGKRANLRFTDLRYVNLSKTNLRYADLEYSNLINTDLTYADLTNTNLTYADLTYADLSNTDLRCADLSNTDLSYADLRYADLRGADLEGANLRYANLSYANLKGANLKDVKTNIHTTSYNLACPEKGSFIGYKKANGYLIELLILEDSKRSSATSVKCRCDKARVLDIENIKTEEKVKEVRSNYDNNFIYRVGEIVSVDNFDEDRWNECSTGIHFFMNKDNAIKY